MKKRYLIILFVVFVISQLCACSRTSFLDRSVASEEKRSNDIANQIVEAVKKNDFEMMKAIFSKKAIENNKKLDAEIIDFFGFVKGTIVSWETEQGTSSEQRSYGKRASHLYYILKILTDSNTYEIIISDYCIDTFDPDNEGILTIMVCHSGDGRLKNYDEFYDAEDEYGNIISSHPGIIIPDLQESVK